MSFFLTDYAVAQWCSALVVAVVAAVSWRRRRSPGGTAFFLTMVAAFVWAVCEGLEASVVGMAGKLLFSTLAYAGTVNVAPLFLVFAIAYRRGGWRPPWWVLAGMWAIPAATVVLAATNGAHGLVWSALVAKPGTTIVVYEHGPWWWVALGYYAALALAAAAIIAVTALRTDRIYARQAAILLAGLALPWIATVVYLLPGNPLPGLDLAPVAFAFSGFLLLVGLGRFRLLDVVPVARDTLVEDMDDGLVVLDDRDRVVDMNPAARRLFATTPEAVGRPLEEAVPVLAPVLARLGAGAASTELALAGDSARHLDVRSSVLAGRDGVASGRLLVIRDLTERKRLELEREKLIGDLQSALADVKTLRGLLPICASCKKIRDDQGYWLTLERYFQVNSEIQFSHGLCPDCVQRLYPDLAKELPGPAGDNGGASRS